MDALIFDIQRGSFVDGDGIRTTVFFKGCNLRCKWCHNPEGLRGRAEMLVYNDRCTGCQKCAEICPNGGKECTLCSKCVYACPNNARQIVGKKYTEGELLREILKDKAYYDASGGGVTFSGGECMLQIDFLCRILTLCRQNGINTAVDTAGNVPYEYFERILPCVSEFLYDVKCISEALHISGTGVSNKLILENLQKLTKSGATVTVRVPLVGGFNSSEDELEKIKSYLSKLNLKRVEYLEYHEMAENKYEALNLPYIKFYKPQPLV